MIPADEHLIPDAWGSRPADFILSNTTIVNVFSGETESGDVAILGNHSVGIGDYRDANNTNDLRGRYQVQGLINSHPYPASSILDAGNYAFALVPHGTPVIATNLHEKES